MERHRHALASGGRANSNMVACVREHKRQRHGADRDGFRVTAFGELIIGLAFRQTRVRVDEPDESLSRISMNSQLVTEPRLPMAIGEAARHPNAHP